MKQWRWEDVMPSHMTDGSDDDDDDEEEEEEEEDWWSPTYNIAYNLRLLL